MELRHLRAFVAVAEEKSFRRAAERLNLAQPPVSMQIQQLERELGVRLFERTSRSVRLCRVAENLLPLARSVLAGAEQLRHTAEEVAEGEVGSLSIGYLPSSLGPLLANALRSFHAAHPNVQISLAERRAPQQVDALLAGDLDLGLTHRATERPELATELYSEAPVALALPSGHRLARLSRIPLKSLRGERLILMRPELAGGFYDSFLAACNAAGISLPVFQYTNDFMTKLWLVAAGFGVSPTMLPWMRLPNIDVVYRPLAAHLPHAKLFLAYRRTNESPLIRKFIAHVRRAREESNADSSAR
jgi:DNA-binding transcriptional LysR family regulator